MRSQVAPLRCLESMPAIFNLFSSHSTQCADVVKDAISFGFFYN